MRFEVEEGEKCNIGGVLMEFIYPSPLTLHRIHLYILSVFLFCKGWVSHPCLLGLLQQIVRGVAQPRIDNKQ